MRQVKLTLPDDVADWLDSELGASHGTRGTVAGDIVQAAFLAFKLGDRQQKFGKHVMHVTFYTRTRVIEAQTVSGAPLFYDTVNQQFLTQAEYDAICATRPTHSNKG